jgi:hypothetical protein
MIAHNFDFQRIGARPDETNPILVVDSNAEWVPAISSQLFQPKAFPSRQIGQCICVVKKNELSISDGMKAGRELLPGRLAGAFRRDIASAICSLSVWRVRSPKSPKKRSSTLDPAAAFSPRVFTNYLIVPLATARFDILLVRLYNPRRLFNRL